MNAPLHHAHRSRIGISIGWSDVATVLDVITEAETASVEQLWMGQSPVSVDALTVYATAFERTQSIRLGTSIVPTYPRHPSRSRSRRRR